MSWFTRLREFKEEEDALADSIETELDNIEAAFNGLFKAATVTATGSTTLSAGFVDVTGATVTVDQSIASLAIITMKFEGGSLGISGTDGGYLNVDGSNQEPRSNLSDTQVAVVKLSAGSHVLKLQAKGVGTLVARTGFSYLIVPDPSP